MKAVQGKGEEIFLRGALHGIAPEIKVVSRIEAWAQLQVVIKRPARPAMLRRLDRLPLQADRPPAAVNHLVEVPQGHAGLLCQFNSWHAVAVKLAENPELTDRWQQDQPPKLGFGELEAMDAGAQPIAFWEWHAWKGHF